VLSRGPLAFLGRVSYSAYLYHLPLLLLWNAYARSVPSWLSLPAYLALLLAVSWLSLALHRAALPAEKQKLVSETITRRKPVSDPF
jgi:peptidoglycan/LPS O-acetylase OafA/YrhL